MLYFVAIGSELRDSENCSIYLQPVGDIANDRGPREM
jgi:hypothetical protein